MERVTSTIGSATIPFVNDTWICMELDEVRTIHGLYHGDNPLNYGTPLLLAQVVVIVIVSNIFYFLLKPLRQSSVSAEILAGIFLGPSFLQNYVSSVHHLFPIEGRTTLHIISDMGLIFHLFVLTLKMDSTILVKAGSDAYIMAAGCVLMPATLGGLAFLIIKSVAKHIDPAFPAVVFGIVKANSVSSFPVIAGVLADLKILNSDIGRLAAKVAVISDLTCFIGFQTVAIFLQTSVNVAIDFFISTIMFVLAIGYILRPMIKWVTFSIKEVGETLRDFRFFVVVVCVLLCSLFSEILGQHYAFGPLMLGMVLPDGPPLAVEMEIKIQSFITSLILPVSCALGGLNTNMFVDSGKDMRAQVIIIVTSTYIGKFAGTLGSAIFCGIPLKDAFCLTLILCCKGIVEIAIYGSTKDAKIFDTDTFNILIISMLVVTGVARSIVSFLYDPSRRFMTKRRRTILGSDYNNLLVLVCVYSSDDVPTTIKLLRACNPTRISPITIFVLHLMKLTGSASPIYLPHHKLDKLQYRGYRSVHSVKAFDLFEEQHQGSIMVQHFIAIAPYRCMHRDICTTALDRRTTILVLPFHKRWSIDGDVESTNPAVRDINKTVMDIAPCSVGILIDRGQIGGKQAVLIGDSLYQIAVLFFGCDDDWEALALSKRMLDNPQVKLLIVLFRYDSCIAEKEKDYEYLVENFKYGESKDRVHFKDFTVKDGEETTEAIRTLKDNLDLVIVGRHHDPNSPLVLGLMEWSECPELGIIGDLLSSSDFQFSVLVIVQQPLKIESGITNTTKFFMPLNNNRSLNSRETDYIKDQDFRPSIK